MTFREWPLDLKTYFSSIKKKTELIKTKLIKQIEEINSSSLPENSLLTNEVHPESIYKSRQFNL